MITDLTPRQKSVLDYIISFQQRQGIAPTVREIGRHLGLSSPASVHRLLTVLKEKGYLLADKDKNRSWRFKGPLPHNGISVVGRIAAGDPIEAIHLQSEALEIAPAVFGCETCFGLRVQGESMIDAHIMDGDLAIIRPQQRVENGEIAAVMVAELLPEATLKIVRRTRSTLSLAPANKYYETLVFKGVERKRVSIVGKFVGIVRRA